MDSGGPLIPGELRLEARGRAGKGPAALTPRGSYTVSRLFSGRRSVRQRPWALIGSFSRRVGQTDRVLGRDVNGVQGWSPGTHMAGTSPPEAGAQAQIHGHLADTQEPPEPALPGEQPWALEGAWE